MGLSQYTSYFINILAYLYLITHLCYAYTDIKCYTVLNYTNYISYAVSQQHIIFYIHDQPTGEILVYYKDMFTGK